MVVVSATWMRVDPKVCASVERFIVEREMARKERPDRGERKSWIAGSRFLAPTREIRPYGLSVRTYQCVIMVGQWSVDRHQIPLSLSLSLCVYLRLAKGTMNSIET